MVYAQTIALSCTFTRRRCIEQLIQVAIDDCLALIALARVHIAGPCALHYTYMWHCRCCDRNWSRDSGSGCRAEGGTGTDLVGLRLAMMLLVLRCELYLARCLIAAEVRRRGYFLGNFPFFTLVDARSQ